ncbi:MAG: flagellar hook protein FlgE [Minwuia sp.]|nr:flagellar hook protein FlgE [Minwuia sp.]
MSIIGALQSGVSGLNAQSQSMSVIANNISNVNTVGYKASRAAFSTLVTQTVAATGFSTGGVRSESLQLNDVQGLLQQTTSATDMAISGDGFFVVNNQAEPDVATGQFLFTRAGQFVPNEDGDLANTAGLFLQGWPINETGDIPSNRTDLNVLETVNVRGLTGSAEATTDINLRANLQATQPVNANVGAYVAGDMAAGNFTPDFQTSVQMFDSQGGVRNMTFSYLKSATPNEWFTEAHAEPIADVDIATHPNGLVASGTTAFNTDGTMDLTNSSAGLRSLAVTWNTNLGIDDSTLAVNYGSDGEADGLSQFNGTSRIISSDVNGAVFGGLAGVQVGDDGVVTALFDNGTREDIFKLPIATFPNANGLEAKTGNAFLATNGSGDFSLNEAGTGSAGVVAASAVEGSTVDLTQEFTLMIETQRAFSANGRIITTADEMLNELVNLKR